MRHAIVDHQVGEIREAQELSLLAPQVENPADDLAIVEIAGRRPHIVGVINVLPDGPIVQVCHERQITGRLQGESPARHAFCLSALLRRRHRAFRKAGQFRLVGDYQLERVGGIQDMFGEQSRLLAQLYVDLRQPRFAGRVQACAVPFEIVDRLL